MSTSEFGSDDEPLVYNPDDYLPIAQADIDTVSRQIDNALDLLPGGSITLSRVAGWNMRGIAIRLDVSKDFQEPVAMEPTTQLKINFFAYEDDENVAELHEPPEDGCIKVAYDSEEGSTLEVNGFKGFDIRSSDEMCLFAGQIVRAIICVQANPEVEFSEAEDMQFDYMHERLLRILDSDRDDVLGFVRELHTPHGIRDDVITKAPDYIMTALEKARLGALIIDDRIHLGVEQEADTTLSRSVVTVNLEDGLQQKCHYRRIFTPSAFRVFCREDVLYRAKDYFTITEFEPQPKIITEEAPEYTLEPIGLDASLTQLSTLVPVTNPAPCNIPRDAFLKDFQRIEPELAILHAKYGI